VSPITFVRWLEGYLEDRELNQTSVEKIKSKLKEVQEILPTTGGWIPRDIQPYVSPYFTPTITCSGNNGDSNVLPR
jgi:hypothetical protein